MICAIADGAAHGDPVPEAPAAATIFPARSVLPTAGPHVLWPPSRRLPILVAGIPRVDPRLFLLPVTAGKSGRYVMRIVLYLHSIVSVMCVTPFFVEQ